MSVVRHSVVFLLLLSFVVSVDCELVSGDDAIVDAQSRVERCLLDFIEFRKQQSETLAFTVDGSLFGQRVGQDPVFKEFFAFSVFESESEKYFAVAYRGDPIASPVDGKEVFWVEKLFDARRVHYRHYTQRQAWGGFGTAVQDLDSEDVDKFVVPSAYPCFCPFNMSIGSIDNWWAKSIDSDYAETLVVGLGKLINAELMDDGDVIGRWAVNEAAIEIRFDKATDYLPVRTCWYYDANKKPSEVAGKSEPIDICITEWQKIEELGWRPKRITLRVGYGRNTEASMIFKWFDAKATNIKVPKPNGGDWRFKLEEYFPKVIPKWVSAG